MCDAYRRQINPHKHMCMHRGEFDVMEYDICSILHHIVTGQQ